MSEPPRTIARPGHAPLRIAATPGKLSLTPASHLCLETIDRHHHLLGGEGIDWGSGSGVLAIAAATHRGVRLVVGLELDQNDIATARTNAEMNGVADRVVFLHADGFDALPGTDPTPLQGIRGDARFLIANPPSSTGDDGLEWRRRVLDSARDYLRAGAEVFLQVSRQYGIPRTRALASDVGGYEYRGLLGTTDWAPFDQTRPDLRTALDDYAAEETRSGEPYPFLHPTADRQITATEAKQIRDREGLDPRSQWSMHRFVRVDM